MQNLVYECVNFPKFDPKLHKFGQNLAPNQADKYEWVTFTWKMGIFKGPLSNSQWHISTTLKYPSA